MKKKITIAAWLMVVCLGITSCSRSREYFINSKMDDSESQLMYVTAKDPQEMADKVCNIIIDCDDEKELMTYKSKAANNVKSNCKEVIETLDGDVDDVECIFINVECSEKDRARYTISADYYLTVDGDEYVLSFDVIIVNEYEVYRHGLHDLSIQEYDDYNPNNHSKNVVSPEEAMGNEILVFTTPVTADHHKKVFAKCDEDRTCYDGRALMEEILYLIEDDDDDGLLDLYADVNVNGKDDLEDIAEDQIDELLDKMGGEEGLEAVGGIVDFYSFNLKPSYVDCDDIDYPIEYAMRYVIEVDGKEYKIQVVYVSSEDDSMPDDYVGIQSITFVD